MLRRSILLLSLGVSGCNAHASPPPPSASERAQAAARELFEQGNALARSGDSVKAEQYLAASLREGHDPERVLPVLMRVCLTGSRLRSALNYASPHLKQHPDAVWLRYLVATVYLGLSQPFRAREHLLMIVAQAPEHARSQYLLGLTEWEAFGDRAAATRHFRAYLRLEPKGQYAPEVDDWLRAHANVDLAPAPELDAGAAPVAPEPAAPSPGPASSSAEPSGDTPAREASSINAEAGIESRKPDQ
jgi:predicted Zn-dependent protease